MFSGTNTIMRKGKKEMKCEEQKDKYKTLTKIKKDTRRGDKMKGFNKTTGEILDGAVEILAQKSVAEIKEGLEQSQKTQKSFEEKLHSLNTIIISFKKELPRLEELKKEIDVLAGIVRGQKKKKGSSKKLLVLKKRLEVSYKKEIEEIENKLKDIKANDASIGAQNIIIDLAKLLGGTLNNNPEQKNSEEKTKTHKELLLELMRERSNIKNAINKEKQKREKIFSVVEKCVEGRMDPNVGEKLSVFMVEDSKKLPENFQKDLKRYGLDKREDVLMEIERLIDIHGYSFENMTIDFLKREKEMLSVDVDLMVSRYKNAELALKRLNEKYGVSEEIKCVDKSFEKSEEGSVDDDMVEDEPEALGESVTEDVAMGKEISDPCEFKDYMRLLEDVEDSPESFDIENLKIQIQNSLDEILPRIKEVSDKLCTVKKIVDLMDKVHDLIPTMYT